MRSALIYQRLVYLSNCALLYYPIYGLPIEPRLPKSDSNKKIIWTLYLKASFTCAQVSQYRESVGIF